MTALEAYKTFLLKINKNDTNRNVNISKGNFVIIYNEQSDVWLDDKISKSISTSDKNGISELLIHDLELSKIKDTERFSEFNIPEDYFDYESSFSIAHRGNCKDRILYNWDFKARNKNVLFQDENNNPSFDYEETLINLSDSKLLVFKTDFDIDKQFITYYRQPRYIDIDGYKKVNGEQSTTVDPDLSDVFVNEIINLCAVEVIRSYENPEGFQLAKDRIIKQ